MLSPLRWLKFLSYKNILTSFKYSFQLDCFSHMSFCCSLWGLSLVSFSMTFLQCTCHVPSLGSETSSTVRNGQTRSLDTALIGSRYRITDGIYKRDGRVEGVLGLVASSSQFLL
jgi:hypothetical protein